MDWWSFYREPDLAAVRTEPGFEALVAEVRARAAQMRERLAKTEG